MGELNKKAPLLTPQHTILIPKQTAHSPKTPPIYHPDNPSGLLSS